MKEYLKEQNMRRENDPVSTTHDVGVNNNQLVRESQSTIVSEDAENDNFWVTDGVGLSANYEWCCESGCSADDPEESSSDYDLGWDEDNRCIDWASEILKSSDWKKPVNNSAISGTRDEHDGTTGILDNFWSSSEPQDDTVFNNNEAVLHPIAGDSVNQLDVRRNEDKIFYEKPKLNIEQTVTYLYDSVILPTEKCLNYVNSIKASGESDDIEEPEKTTDFADEVATTSIIKESQIPDTANNAIRDSAKAEIVENIVSNWFDEVPVDVEVVELATSVGAILQFPEIEDIPDSVKSISETGESQTEEIVIERIDLIREAEELPNEPRAKPRIEETKSSSKILEDKEINESEADSEVFYEEQPAYGKLEEIDLLSSIGRDIGVDLEKYVQPVPDVIAMEAANVQASRALPAILKDTIGQDTNKLLDQDLPDVSSADTRKKEKMARNQARRRQASSHSSTTQNRRPDKRRTDRFADCGPGGFDVYNIETALPKIDLDAIESHLRAAREEERRENERVTEVVEAVVAGREPDSNHRDKEDLLARFNRLLENPTNDSYQRRNDREEIRRRLAMGPDAEDLRAERGRKPSLQSRLQSGMNLQICFMNETPSDTESPGSENDASPGTIGLSSLSKQLDHPHRMASRPQVLSLPPLRVDTGSTTGPLDEADFFARQARLQTEARMALAQAKEMAHMQMEVERQRLKQSPITEMVRSSLEKVGVQLGEDRRRLSRLLLTELNVAQLQVVANDLHARIAMLNEALVDGLLRRDDLHMEQDSMLVDIEDLTRYLGAKEESLMKRPIVREQQQRNAVPSSRKIRANQQTSTRTGASRETMTTRLANHRAA